MSQSNSDEETKPEQIYALVVGIEEYGYSELLVELDGPVKNSIEFTQWLTSQGVPEDQIMLFLSPLAKNRSLCSSLSYEPASQQNIVDAIYHLQTKSQRSKGFLYVFWGGHGWETIEPTGSGDAKVRRLFFADCSADQWKNLNFNSFSAAMSRPRNQKGFDRQIYFIDACATLAKTAEISKLQANQATFSMDAARGTPNRQYVVFASGDYIEAKNDNQSGDGIFSRAVLEKLKQDVSATIFFSDTTKMNAFTEDLRHRLKQEDMAPAQWIHDWDGSVDTVEAKQDRRPSYDLIPAPDCPDSFASESLLDLAKAELLEQYEQLKQEYKKISAAKRVEVNPASRLRLDKQGVMILQELKEIEQQLQQLGK